MFFYFTACLARVVYHIDYTLRIILNIFDFLGETARASQAMEYLFLDLMKALRTPYETKGLKLKTTNKHHNALFYMWCGDIFENQFFSLVENPFDQI